MSPVRENPICSYVCAVHYVQLFNKSSEPAWEFNFHSQSLDKTENLKNTQLNVIGS